MTPSARCSLDRFAIEAIQLEKLQLLLTTVLSRNPFYSAKLQRAGVSAAIASLAEFVAAVPFTDKSEIVDDQSKIPAIRIQLVISAGTLHSISPDQRYHRYSGPLAGYSGELGVDGRLLDSGLSICPHPSARPGILSIFVWAFPGILGGVRCCNSDGVSIHIRRQHAERSAIASHSR